MSGMVINYNKTKIRAIGVKIGVSVLGIKKAGTLCGKYTWKPVFEFVTN